MQSFDVNIALLRRHLIVLAQEDLLFINSISCAQTCLLALALDCPGFPTCPFRFWFRPRTVCFCLLILSSNGFSFFSLTDFEARTLSAVCFLFFLVFPMISSVLVRYYNGKITRSSTTCAIIRKFTASSPLDIIRQFTGIQQKHTISMNKIRIQAEIL